MTGGAGKRKRHDSYVVSIPGEDDEDEEEDIVEEIAQSNMNESGSLQTIPLPIASTSAVGSALQRDPDGNVVAPKIRHRSRKVR